MSNEEVTVCVVTVTYGNRSGYCMETAQRSIQAGAARVVIVDNGSSDESATAYAAMALVSDQIEVVRLDHNLGSAVGFSSGMRAALATDCTHVWLLDDDNWVAEDALANLLACRASLVKVLDDTDVVTASFRTANSQHRLLAAGTDAKLVFPREGSFLSFDVVQYLRRRLSRPGIGSANLLDRTRIPHAPYGGLLVPRAVIERVGTPNPELVLYEDDTAWTAKIVGAGYRIQFCAESKITDAHVNWSAEAHGRGPVRGLRSNSPVRLYYAARNRIIFDRSQVSTKQLKWRYFVNKLVFLGYILVAEPSKAHRASRRALFRAVRDGEKGDLTLGPPLEGVLQRSSS
jgi:GT2 family glycosyltransferase